MMSQDRSKIVCQLQNKQSLNVLSKADLKSTTNKHNTFSVNFPQTIASLKKTTMSKIVPEYSCFAPLCYIFQLLSQSLCSEPGLELHASLYSAIGL
jgi:hypothetical protein